MDPLNILLVLIAPAVGSFLALLADRLPRGEPVIIARSACRSCAHELGLRDLVPVMSFALNAGRCRHCQAPIPPWLLYSEIAATGLAVIALGLSLDPAIAWLSAFIFWLLLALTLTDLLWFRLPDVLTGALLLVALGLAGMNGPAAVTTALWGAVWGAGSFWLLRVSYKALRGREGLGLGDVKLMAGCGALLGPHGLPVMILTAALTTLTCVAIPALIRPKNGRVPPLSARRALPFGAALAAATAVIWGAFRAGSLNIGGGL